MEFLAGGGLQDQGPALEHHEAAGLIQGPFHILGTVVVLFQSDAVPRQDLDLGRGQAGLILELRRHRALMQAGNGIGHQLDGLASHLHIQDGEIAGLGDPIGVRGDHPVHRIGSQAPNRADEDIVIPDVKRMMGIHHAAGHRIHHLEADDAHGDVFIPDALVEPVRNGPGRVETGQDLFVSRNQLISRDIQDGKILPGEGEFAVFPDGAGAHGHPDRGFTHLRSHPGISCS